MACIRKRRGKYVVDYRDGTGRRRWITLETRREADNALAQAVRESRQSTQALVDPDVRLEEYARHWLELIASSVKERTLENYRDVLERHVLPTFGRVKVRQLHRGRIKSLLAQKLQGGLSRERVRQIHAGIRVMLNAAVDDGVILANPALQLGRALRLVTPKTTRQERIKAFDRNQLARFLEKTRELAPDSYPLFLLLARSGMRVGEAIALQWDDLDFANREIRIDRAISAGRVSTPKSGHGRSVDMSHGLADQLARLDAASKADKLRRGLPERPPWVFASSAGTPLDPSKIAKTFRRVLTAAELPHFTLHGFRHSFASLLLQQGESPAYVQRQLGHASIQLTVDTYGKWLPMGNKAAVDRLDEPSGSKVVAESSRATGSTA